VAALLGFGCGLLFPAWHVAIEPAQVAAGLVTYPPGNPFALYETRVWNVWHQLLTPLLAAGVPARTLTYALSGAVGAFNFGALALFACAMGARPGLALFAPLMTWFLNPMSMAWGFSYPILMVGEGHTYGMVGLAWFAIACGTLGIGRLGLGAFLIGLAPAFHASLGAWLALLAGVAGLTMWSRLRPQLGAIVGGGLLGAAVSAASLAAHMLGRAPEPPIDPALARRYLDAFVQLWDAHRVPPEPAWNFVLLAAATLLAGVLAFRRSNARSVGEVLALRVYVATALLGLAMVAVLYGVPERSLPSLLLIGMPTRLLNLPVLLYVPLLIGVFSRKDADPVARVAFTVLAGTTVLWPLAHWLERVVLPSLGVVAAVLAWRGVRPRELPRLDRFLSAATACAISATILLEIPVAFRGHPRRAAAVASPSTDAAIAAASEIDGVIAVAPAVENAQAMTQRPLVLDPMALDMLPYALAGAPEVERILADLYGIEFFDPPGSALRQGVVPYGRAKTIWESRAQVGWLATASRIGFTHVLAPSEWTIDLPLVAKSGVYALYRVPGAPAAGSQ